MTAAPISFRAFAAWARISRNRLRPHIERGDIQVVPFGRGFRIPASEVERIAREGLPAIDAQGRRRRAPRRSATAIPPADIEAQIRRLPYGRGGRAS